MIEALIFGSVLGLWISAVTTESGRAITAWAAHLIGIFVMIVMMTVSMLWALVSLTSRIGV